MYNTHTCARTIPIRVDDNKVKQIGHLVELGSFKSSYAIRELMKLASEV